jgi:hypothetical protein
MLRSAVLLCPIAYLNHLTSPFARALVDLFIAEVKPNGWICLTQKNEFPNLNLKEKNSLTFLLSILSHYCTGLVLVRTT